MTYAVLNTMRNDAASVPLAAPGRALHARDAPNPQCFLLISTMES